MSDPPLACSLDTAGLHARRTGLLAELAGAAASQDPLPDGVCLRFAADSETLALLTRVIDAERRCCRFLRFRLAVEPDEGPMVLELTGPPGTREFFLDLLAL